ncbi:MAG: HipA N-terminal domain-containing protein [Verrucomicrobiales bacterium]|nr:HipA N-terminal domain-containing protein [Verrucomicrobiales bacterium]
MSDFEVHLSRDGRDLLVGRARSNVVRGKETVLFEYADEWMEAEDRFPLAPDLPLTRGAFPPPSGLAIHAALGDSAPDSWGRRRPESAGAVLRPRDRLRRNEVPRRGAPEEARRDAGLAGETYHPAKEHARSAVEE